MCPILRMTTPREVASARSRDGHRGGIKETRWSRLPILEKSKHLPGAEAARPVRTLTPPWSGQCPGSPPRLSPPPPASRRSARSTPWRGRRAHPLRLVEPAPQQFAKPPDLQYAEPQRRDGLLPPLGVSADAQDQVGLLVAQRQKRDEVPGQAVVGVGVALVVGVAEMVRAAHRRLSWGRDTPQCERRGGVRTFLGRDGGAAIVTPVRGPESRAPSETMADLPAAPTPVPPAWRRINPCGPRPGRGLRPPQEHHPRRGRAPAGPDLADDVE